MTALIRELRPDDAAAVNRVALAAWDQYRGLFSNWARSAAIFANAAAANSYRAGLDRVLFKQTVKPRKMRVPRRMELVH
jgi:hypothetical protein